MKKTFLLFLSIIIFSAMVGGIVIAADQSSTPIVRLGVQSVIAINCTSDVTMNPIVGTGRSTITGSNEAMCNISTNNSNGYKLEWAASPTMSNGGTDTINAYTPETSNIPEVWSVASSASEWGARLKSTSTDTASEWGTADGYNVGSNWLNVSPSRQIVSRNFPTISGGSMQIIQFGAEIGAGKTQPTGNYVVAVTFTATTL